MGASDYLRSHNEDVRASYYSSGSSDEISLDTSTSASLPSLSDDFELFQQGLVLALASGELVSLFMVPVSAGCWEVLLSYYPSQTENLVDPGSHMAISPNGRHLALACSENLFTIYELEAIKELRRQYRNGQSICPFLSVRARAVKAIIQKIEFLHPRPENASHTVLLMLTVQSGVPRLTVYEWENTDQLQCVLDEEMPGHRLDMAAGVPLLIIPLAIPYQFVLITERSMAICPDVLSGPPIFVPFELAAKWPSEYHHGTHLPIWTAWTRPPREESYYAGTDLIYIAREDGWVNCLEFSHDSGLESSLYMGPLKSNIDTAFTSLSSSGGDFLLAGGSDGPGSIWFLQPTKPLLHVGTLPSWTPTVDFISLTLGSKVASESMKASKRELFAKPDKNHLLAPERIFACSGTDEHAAIVEFRHGIEAKIGLSFLYRFPIKKCWAIPTPHSIPEAGFFLLLALPERSALLHISHDLQVTDKSAEATGFDLSSPTLAVRISEDVIIQITEANASILSRTSSVQYSIREAVKDPMSTVLDAVITDQILALSVYNSTGFEIMVFYLDGGLILTNVFKVGNDVSALSVVTLPAGIFILAGVSRDGYSALAIYPVLPDQSKGQTIPNIQQELRLEDEDIDLMRISAVTSIVCLDNENIIVGKRNGDVHTIQITDSNRPSPQLKITRTNHFGVAPSHVYPGIVFDTGPSALVCNREGLTIMKEPSGNSGIARFEEIFNVWLTDANDPNFPSVSICSVATLHHIPNYDSYTWAMVSGKRIYIAKTQHRPTSIPRYLPIDGTPLKIIYSERLNALVTVVKENGTPNLRFIHPATGVNLSHGIRIVMDGKGKEKGYVDVSRPIYMGNADFKVTSLLKWNYRQRDNDYEWFVVILRKGDNQGRILVISAEEEKESKEYVSYKPPEEANAVEAPIILPPPRRIRFWTHFCKKLKGGPPRSGTTDENGLFVNFGTTVEYYIIEKDRFKAVMRYDLPSPASSLEVVDGRLNILTNRHSLIILDYKSNVAVQNQQMVPLYTDSVARNGLHSIDVSLQTAMSEEQRVILMSDPMCGIYGLWSPAQQANTSDLQLMFKADLLVSIRKFIRVYTQPRWTRSDPRYGLIQGALAKHFILGLAVDGSLTQFLVIHEEALRLLRYIQDLAMASRSVCHFPRRNDEPQLDANSCPKTRMHINGDILQRVLDKRLLEQVAAGPEELSQLQELLRPLGLGDFGGGSSMMRNLDRLLYERIYDVLAHYLTPVL
ncbi:hypothetical protein F4802DRAFT_566574 [Xylaria palmicola]|nr:hypothetical protein F4802DRAFT_566574 [Xylaria palmicola]